MRQFTFILVAGALAATTAVAAPVYTTSVTVAYNPAAPKFCDPACVSTNASNNSSYTVRTGEDSTYFYVDVTSTPNMNTDQSLQFANIYIGGPKFPNALVIEVTNNRASTTDNPSGYASLAGTGFTFTKSLNDISFALPFAYLEANPSHLNYGTVSPGDLIRVSQSQSFGYSLVSGSLAPYDPVTRLGAQIVPAAVPEPETLALLAVGMLGFAAARRRRAK